MPLETTGFGEQEESNGASARIFQGVNAALSLKLIKTKLYLPRQPLRSKLQSLPRCRWLQIRNFSSRTDRKNIRMCCSGEKHRAAQGRECWHGFCRASVKQHWRKDADMLAWEEITNLLPQNLLVNRAWPNYFEPVFFQELILIVKAQVMLSGCTQMLCIPGVARHLSNLTQNKGVFFKAADLHGKVMTELCISLLLWNC